MESLLRYSIVIEPTEDPEFFGYYSPDLPGYTGTGTSIADCISNAMNGFDAFLEFRREFGLPAPPVNSAAEISILRPLPQFSDALEDWSSAPAENCHSGAPIAAQAWSQVATKQASVSQSSHEYCSQPIAA